MVNSLNGRLDASKWVRCGLQCDLFMEKHYKATPRGELPSIVDRRGKNNLSRCSQQAKLRLFPESANATLFMDILLDFIEDFIKRSPSEAIKLRYLLLVVTSFFFRCY